MIRRRSRTRRGRRSACGAVGIPLLSAGLLAGRASSSSAPNSQAAVCIRANGVPGYPDPRLIDGSIDPEFNGKFNPDSPAFQRAAGKCGKRGVSLAGTLPPG